MTDEQSPERATNQKAAITPDEQKALRAEMDEMEKSQAQLPPQRIAALKAMLAERDAENKHLFERVVIAESMNAQMEAYLAEMVGKKLAALVLAGEVKPYEFDDRRLRALNELHDRVANMRRRAEQAVNNMADNRRDR